MSVTHVKGARFVAALLCLAVLPAQSETPATTLGKQRAAASPLQWEVRDAGHPILGDIRFAVLKGSVETAVGNAKVYSRAYLSCQKGSKKLAIELANATGPEDPGGLKANADPRLLCNRATADNKMVREELLATWDFNELGDALAKGFRPFPLRECASIAVVQEVALPKGWTQKSARVEFEIAPYNRELDAVFVACGEKSAYAPTAAPPKLAAAPVPAPAPAPAKGTTAAPLVAAKPAPTADASWQSVRTVANGKTNVRGTPNIAGPLVTTLDPGAIVLVQKTGNEWWKARAPSGAAFEGYIRQDRLAFK